MTKKEMLEMGLREMVRQGYIKGYADGLARGKMEAFASVRALAAKGRDKSFDLEDKIPSGFASSYCRGYRDSLQKLGDKLDRKADNQSPTITVNVI